MAAAQERYVENDTLSKMSSKKKIDSATVDSAHVQSQLSSSFHACFNISIPGDTIALINSLKKNQSQLDTSLRARLTKLSTAAENELRDIIDDTRRRQQDVLAYDKSCQLQQNELYQEWLQKYIVVLNRWRSEELDNLQSELSKYQQKITQKFTQRIEALNNRVNQCRHSIWSTEQQNAIDRTNHLTAEMIDITTTNSQFLGSQAKVEFNLRIQANAGRIASGQSCTKKF